MVSHPHLSAEKYFTSLVLLLILLLAGCSPAIHSKLEDPPLTIPAQFSRTGDAELSGDWWLDLADPNLSLLTTEALTHNFTVLEARERLLQAEAVATQAGAARLPSLDGNGRASQSSTRTDGRTNENTNLLLGVGAAYEVDLWGRLRALEEAAVRDVLASQEDLASAAVSVSAELATTWYRLAESYSQMDLLRQQQEVNRLGLDLIRLRFNAGQVGIADILQQRQLIESQDGELAQQKAATELFVHQLALLTGKAPNVFTLPARPAMIELPPLPDTGVPADLLTNRPDVRSSFFRLRAADQRVAAAVADQYPRLSIAADLDTSGTASDLFSNWFGSLAANLVGPIFDGGTRQAEVERTNAVARERLYSYGNTIAEAIAEVEDALVQEHEQRKLIASLTIQLELASQTLLNLRDRYKSGAEDYQRVLSALLSQQTLQRNLLSAKRQLIDFRINLYRALGGQASL